MRNIKVTFKVYHVVDLQLKCLVLHSKQKDALTLLECAQFIFNVFFGVIYLSVYLSTNASVFWDIWTDTNKVTARPNAIFRSICESIKN